MITSRSRKWWHNNKHLIKQDMIYDIQFEIDEAERFTEYLNKTDINIIEIFKTERFQGKKVFMDEFHHHFMIFRRTEKIKQIINKT